MRSNPHLCFNTYDSKEKAENQSERLKNQGYKTQLIKARKEYRLMYWPKKTFRMTRVKNKVSEPTEEEIKKLEEEIT